MSTEFWAIITVGLALAGLILRLSGRVDRLEQRLDKRIDDLTGNLGKRIDALAGDLGEIRERLARLEGMLETIFRLRLDQDHDNAA